MSQNTHAGQNILKYMHARNWEHVVTPQVHKQDTLTKSQLHLPSTRQRADRGQLHFLSETNTAQNLLNHLVSRVAGVLKDGVRVHILSNWHIAL